MIKLNINSCCIEIKNRYGTKTKFFRLNLIKPRHNNYLQFSLIVSFS